MSYYVHDVPGRLRVKIPSLKRSSGTAEDIRRILDSIEGVDSTAVNPLTGSVLVTYDSKSLNAKRILDSLTKRGYFDSARVVRNDDYVNSAVSRAGGLISKALIGLILEKAFEGSALSLLTVLI